MLGVGDACLPVWAAAVEVQDLSVAVVSLLRFLYDIYFGFKQIGIPTGSCMA